jgi:hypothetical protein
MSLVIVRCPLAALYSHATGYANAFGNDFGDRNNTAPVGTLTASSPPYAYSLLGSEHFIAAAVGPLPLRCQYNFALLFV